METGAIILIVIAIIAGLAITGFGVYELVNAINSKEITFRSIALPLFGLLIIGVVIFISFAR